MTEFLGSTCILIASRVNKLLMPAHLSLTNSRSNSALKCRQFKQNNLLKLPFELMDHIFSSTSFQR